MKTNLKHKGNNITEKELTRKEWLKDLGKYAAFTAASMLLILDPVKSRAQDPSDTIPDPPF